ncbi:nucleotide disphospho-sugar-binding domain-containing protein [Actinokineospora enzanensis]|uniref:nucleotide disphospho-sugar-binding domain-containing protein n=1 Tax=Actinokineospora enzanensis TaxID=155975 RepID=UPI00035F6EC0|nr:nucleotide disphospho-sugar-binding domain-containing protein [Actinokineospora enzanensis]
MRVLMTTYPGPSFYYPIVSLGWALRAAGHEVLVATQPAFAPKVTGTGLPAVGLGPDVDVAAMFRQGFDAKLRATTRLPASWPGTVTGLRDAGLLPGVLRGLDHFRDVAEVLADDLVAFGRSWRPDLVVHEPTAVGGPLLARVLGIPSVRHVWGPDFFHWMDELAGDRLAPLARRFGVDDLRAAGDLTVDPCPTAMRAPGSGPAQAVRCVPYNGPGVVPDWLREPPSRSRVLLTWGTWIRDNALTHLFRVPEILRALREHDAEVLVTAGAAERELLGEVPDNVRLIDPTPLHLVLPTCDAIVHQGGTGTVMTAATHGLPQLAVPQVPDQLFNAERMAAAGVGHYLPTAEASADAVAERFAAVVGDPALRERAVRTAAEIAAQPPLAQVCEVLERLANSERAQGALS